MNTMDSRLADIPCSTSWYELAPCTFYSKDERTLALSCAASHWYLGYLQMGSKNRGWIIVSELEAMLLLQGSGEEALKFYQKLNPNWIP